tara:strand:+ start:3070 stop:3927 length:858 start_codon:yes stop_codon:yes gene_type:complete
MNSILASLSFAIGLVKPFDLGIIELFHENTIVNRFLISQSDTYVKSEIVTGKGKTLEQASKNAAMNALLKASPRYQNQRTVIRNKETLINNKFDDNESIKNFRQTSYGYNKGSIVSFKVISSSLKDELFSVVALVKVRQRVKEEFHPLFKPQESKSKDLGVKKVFKIGTGDTEEGAINDAMSQALMEVIADNINIKKNFYSNESLIYMTSKAIEKSLLLSTKKIDDIKSSYTEGFIESFDKIRVYERGDGLINVEAEIIVREKTFSSYLDEVYDDSGIIINLEEK